MITEDYISFETAKLLKEKEFKGLCTAYYDCFTIKNFHDGGEPTDYNSIDPKIRNIISAPTLQMAMKWLREEKNIFIDVYYDSDIKGYLYSIIKLPKGTTLNVSDLADDTYEVACEEAIKYCLENIL